MRSTDPEPRASVARPDPSRRTWLARAGAGALAFAAGPLVAAETAGGAAAGTAALRLAAAWRGPRVGDPHQVGIVEVPADDVGTLRFAAVREVPSRPHGLLAMPDGGFVAVAFRGGDWLWRLDREARVAAHRRLDRPGLQFSGHVVVAPDGAHLLATATEIATGTGWIAVHDAGDLSLQALWRSGGVEPHQLLVAADGGVLVGHGGLRRDAEGRRLVAVAPQASLDRLDARDGRPLGQWRLDDPALSIRHLAWDAADGGMLGVALQAEHPDAARRRDAPAVAVWRADRGLAAVEASRGLGGLAGDIAPAAGRDGWVFSQAAAASAWVTASTGDGKTEPAVRQVAALREAGALATCPADAGAPPVAEGTWIASARGLARWHPRWPPRLLAWPHPIAPDNHLAVLSGT